jgi:lipopolysaccharide export system protein LptC
MLSVKARAKGNLPMMSQSGYPRSDQPGLAGDGQPTPPRQQAFRAAARHTRRVKLLRRSIVGVAVFAGVSIFLISYFHTPDLPGSHLQLDHLGLSGDKITMENPKLTGVRRDGRPFEVTAQSGTQNPHEPSRMELNVLDAKIRMTDDGDTRIVGDHGTYDSNAQTLLLAGHVRITSGAYKLTMQRALMNFKSNSMYSNDPVSLTFGDGWVNANSMIMSDNGAQLSFVGNVQSTFQQDAPAPDLTRQN